jgi:hypothetical protein
MFAHSPLYSMRTGIYYQAHNRYSYSDFRQGVTLPWGISSARVGFWAYRLTNEPTTASVPMLSREELSNMDGTLKLSPEEGDLQYLLILNRFLTLVDWVDSGRTHDPVWRYFEYNIPTQYWGTRIYLQWGTYNNGWGGVTSMYIDDATLTTCP